MSDRDVSWFIVIALAFIVIVAWGILTSGIGGKK